MERFPVTTCTRFTPEDRRALAAILRSQEKILSVLTDDLDDYIVPNLFAKVELIA